MFIVITFGFGLGSDVKIRYLGKNLARAQEIYRELKLAGSEGEGYKDLVEVVEIKEEFDGDYTCFWGHHPVLNPLPEGVEVMSSNNIE